MIHVENDWYILADDYSYCLCRDTGKTDKDGKKIYDGHKYYPSIEMAIQGYMRIRMINVLSNKDLELYEALNALKQEIKRINEFMRIDNE